MTLAKTNNPRFSMAFRKASLKERFNKSYKVTESGCWEWVGTCHVTGYGIIRNDRINLLAHRVSWQLSNGPTKLCVLHRCDNRKCVNPEHLFTGTRLDNNVDRNLKNRQAKGEKQHSAKLTEKNVKEIIAAVASGVKYKALAQKFNVHYTTICNIIGGWTWKHLTRSV